jgi:hypothetical protein
MLRNERLDDHQRFEELAALAHGEALNESEQLELKRHLEVCSSCRQAYDEYALIGGEGMDFLAAAYGVSQETRIWDDRLARDKLLARIRGTPRPRSSRPAVRLLRFDRTPVSTSVPVRWAVVAACVLAVALGAYKLGGRHGTSSQPPLYESAAKVQRLAYEEKTSNELIAQQNVQLSGLQSQVVRDQHEIARLQGDLRAAEAHSAALSATKTGEDEQLRKVSEERDKLAGQLRDAEHSYELVQAELTTLRAEHDRVLLHTASLESKIDELTASARDQERRLTDDEQYLASDRDIRELMGARKLYIADVFDVDSGSRTRKPFGRVFYTENKSLIFYAFDLDRQPGVKNASAFQVWGQRDAETGEKNHAMNLGILYMDSESNRRWVLRLDDPKQLAEIDAVFVTVEPQGGSQKPTGKPFLYALLRREANHP